VPAPHTAPALSDDDVVPVRGLSHRGSHSNGGETPVSVSLLMEHFSRALFLVTDPLQGHFVGVCGNNQVVIIPISYLNNGFSSEMFF